MSWVKDHSKEQSSWESSDNKNRGRKKIEMSKKRKQRFTMNLNDAEFKVVQAAAEATGQTQASFARIAALEKAKSILK